MEKSLLLAFLFLSGVAFAASQDIEKDHPNTSLAIESTSEGSLVKFEDQRQLQTNVFDLQYLGALDTEDESLPFLVFEGYDCENCDRQKFVYMVRKDGAHPMRFVYPGQIRDARSQKLLFEGDAYFGHCLHRQDKGVFLMHQKEKLDRRRYLQTSVYIAEPSTDGVREQILVRGRPQLHHVQSLVRQKKCFKIKGKNRFTVSARSLGPI